MNATSAIIAARDLVRPPLLTKYFIKYVSSSKDLILVDLDI